MDAHTLRQAQAPLREKYQADPASARTPIRARGSFREPGVSTTVEGFAGPVRAGLHAATGGDGSDACSGDMLLEALLACSGVTLRAVATAMGVEIRSADLSADGFFDARGTLGLDREVPVGATDVTVTAVLDTDADQDRLDRMALSVERYCVVGQSLAVAPTFVIRKAGG